MVAYPEVISLTTPRGRCCASGYFRLDGDSTATANRVTRSRLCLWQAKDVRPTWPSVAVNLGLSHFRFNYIHQTVVASPLLFDLVPDLEESRWQKRNHGSIAISASAQNVLEVFDKAYSNEIACRFVALDKQVIEQNESPSDLFDLSITEQSINKMGKLAHVYIGSNGFASPVGQIGCPRFCEGRELLSKPDHQGSSGIFQCNGFRVVISS
jgi:hypothetical protein